MKKLLVFIFIISSSCVQTFNSESGDAKLVGNKCNKSNSNLYAACEVIIDQCISCHTGYHNDWINLTTDQQWLNYDGGSLITAGSLAGSLFITELQNYGGTMPKGLSKISDDDFNTLKNWISGL